MGLSHSLLVFSMLLHRATCMAAPAERKWNLTPIRNPIYPLDIVDKLEADTMPNVERWMAKRAGNTNNCTLEKAAVRREWSDLSVPEREEYIRAVLCLQSKPARAPKDTVPGAVSRFDDFVATHMRDVFSLHTTTNHLAAHRYYLWAYEKALRDECGYTGHHPYMNWDRYAHDLLNSPLLNGNMSSMSGDGLPDPYPGIHAPFDPPNDVVPPGKGGGCVTQGPFKDMIVSIGPVTTIVNNVPPNPRKDGLGSNPRCLRRDINVNLALGSTANYTYQVLMEKDIDGFYNRYLGFPFLRNDSHPWGIHSAGHFTWGGDPGGDFFSSPGDPLFHLHHAMIDRVWWIWQMQDPENRVNAIPDPAKDLSGIDEFIISHGGHRFRTRSTAKRGLDEIVIDLGWTAPAAKLVDLNEALGGLGGKFCHVYV